MKMRAKPVRGSVKILLCRKCGADFPIFDYEVESDAEAVGLYSAGTCGGDNLLLVDLTLEEWKQAKDGNLQELPSRFFSVAGHDYRLTHVLRVEQSAVPPAGVSFAEFRQEYKTPTVVYSCPCCDKGEAVSRVEITSRDYLNSEKKIIAIEPLLLVS